MREGERGGVPVPSTGVGYTATVAGVDDLQDVFVPTEGGGEVLVTSSTELEPTLLTLLYSAMTSVVHLNIEATSEELLRQLLQFFIA